jgi:sugar/nucleoside kinase (ribokinase family)
MGYLMRKHSFSIFITSVVLAMFNFNFAVADILAKRKNPNWRERDGGMITLGQGFQDIFYKFDDQRKHDAYIKKLGVNKGKSNLVFHEVIAKVIEDLKPEQRQVGGGASNTAAGIAALGIGSSFHTSIANDKVGTDYLQEIKKYRLSNVVTLFDNTYSTGVIMVIVSPSGQRTMLAHPGISKQIPIITSSNYLGKFKVAFTEGYLLNPPEANNNLVLDFFNSAKKAGSVTAFTFGDLYIIKQYPEQCREIARKVDIIFSDQEQAYEFFKTTDWELIKKEAAKFNTTFIVTFGSKGAYILHKGKEIFVPAEKVEQVVDTTGAGDQFAAGFLYGFIKEYDLETSAKLGAQMAANIIQQIGAKPSVSDKIVELKAEKEAKLIKNT